MTSARIPDKDVITRATCVFSHAFKKEHRDRHIKDAMHLAAHILGRAQ